MRAVLAVLVISGIGLAACGGDDDGGSASGVERYCELAAELDDAFPEEIDADTPEEVTKVLEDFLDEHGDDLDALADSAPDEIKSDVTTAVDAIKKAAQGDLSAANLDTSKVDEFDQENC
ncbi:MAG: hypothetical protein ACRDY7_18500 [Acidimicrobiia bacterium]